MLPLSLLARRAAETRGHYQTINYALSGTSIPVSAAVAHVNSSGTITSNVYVLQGSSNYTGTSVGDDNARCSSTPCYRWGDFSSLMIDPTNSSVMWAAEADAPDMGDWSIGITRVTN
nr:hypothetical protein [Kitasatospora humi]